MTSRRTPTPGPRLGHVFLRRNCRRGTPREPVCAPTDLPPSYMRAPDEKSAFLLDRQSAGVFLEYGLADFVDLLQILHALERAVGLSVRDDAVGRAGADALELHELGFRRLVEVHLLPLGHLTLRVTRGT